ncbi:MAG: c-type cytochrome [Candidatus Nitrotoga sp.]
MKKPRFVIAIAVLILSACGDKSEQESLVTPASPPLVENNTTVASDQLKAPPAKDQVSEMTLSAPTDATPTTSAEASKQPKTNEVIKDELSSRKIVTNIEQSSPMIAEQPIVKPKMEKAPKKVALASSAPKPLSSEKSAKPLTTNNEIKGELLNREEGLALANKSGCLVCHRIETKLVGPAWRDVSKRYKGDPDARARLFTKVKMGGKGNWTDITGGIAMPPNSPRVSDENIEKLVTFVLSQ